MPILTSNYIASWYLVYLNGKYRLLESWNESLQQEVNKWVKSKRKLAALILDQTKITGIGVAWGSEILFKAEKTKFTFLKN